MTDKESLGIPRTWLADRVREQQEVRRMTEEHLKVQAREHRRRVAHEEASPMILETLHLLVQRIDRVERGGRWTMRLTLFIAALTSLVAAGTVALVYDVFFR
jgi:serine/threonine protein phosphatase PrpC